MALRLMDIGTAALESGDTIYQIATALTRQAAETKIIAVVAAMTGVTDMLLDSIRLGNYSSIYTKLLALHTSAARRQGRDETARKFLIQDVTDMLDSYRWLGKSMANRTPTVSESASITFLGEKLCARLLAMSIQNQGVRTVTLNASEVLVLNAQSAPDIPASIQRVQQRLLPLIDQGFLPVITASADPEMAQAAAHAQSAPMACTTALSICTMPDEIWFWTDGENYTVIPASAT